MKTPFYYSFKEFEANYNNDFKEWQKKYPDGLENDYLSLLKDNYSQYAKWSDNYYFIEENIKITIHSEEKLITIDEFRLLIQKKYDDFINSPTDESNRALKEEKDYKSVLMNLFFTDLFFKKGFYFDLFTLEYCLCFFFDEMTEIKTNFSKPVNMISLNDTKYINFRYAVVRIVKWIDEKLKLKSKTEATINNTQENTDEKTQSKFTVPQKIKILDKLNIKGMMQEKGFTDFQTVQLLADIFERSEKSIRNNFDNQNHTTIAENYISELKNLTAKR